MKRIISYILNLYFRITFFRQAAWSAIVMTAVIITALFFTRSSPVVTKPAGWEKSFRISSYNIISKNVQLSTRGNFIIGVYEGRIGRRQGIYASVSFNGGVKFMPSVKITDIKSTIANNPHAAVSGDGKITVMWYNFLEGESTNRIFYSTSSDMGATWEEPQMLNMGYDMEMLPRIYYDDKNRLHLFFHAGKGDTISLFHAISESASTADFTVTGTLIRLTRKMRGAFFPSIHMSDKYFFIVWQGKEEDFSDELFFIKSSNYGKRWSSKKQITFSRGNNASPSILMHRDILYLVYQNNDKKNWVINLQRGLDRGGDWIEQPITVSGTDANCYAPKVVVSGNDLLIVWYDLREGKAQVFSRKYSLVERKLMPETKLSMRKFPSTNPSVFSSGRRFIVLWEEGNMIMAKFSDIYAEPPTVLSDTHPQGKWSRSSVVQLRWNKPADESDIVGYATIVNRLPDFNPTIQNVKGNVKRYLIPDIDDGVSYFHIRSIDGAGNFSRTIHYKLQVSANPLPMPVLASPTHPQGKSVDAQSGMIRWSVDEPDRLMGFVYSLSKEEVKQPEKFTDKFEMNFSNLIEGNYFFTIAAMDRSNQLSRIATYNFIVGQAKKIDPEYLKRIADNEFKDKKKKKKYIIAAVPGISLNLPFDWKTAYNRGSFDALIIPRNIKKENIIGYSVYIDSKKRKLPDRINLKNNILSIKDLVDGEYYIGAKCKYTATVNGKEVTRWTRPYYRKISIVIPGERTPLEFYATRIIEKFSGRSMIVMVLFLTFTVAITTVGYGTRISYYSRLMRFKTKVFFRLLSK